MSHRPRLLLTNDDGIESRGIRDLAVALSHRYDIVVAAPARDMSGSGTGIGTFDRNVGVTMRREDLGKFDAYAVEGPPGLAVMAASLGAFGKTPDLVVSGINAGINTGHSIIHSGTVGAALTAGTFASRGLAVSLEESDPWHWETAVEVACAAARWMLSRKGEPSMLNVNVPALPLDDVKGVHWADLDAFGYFRVANTDPGSAKLQFEVRTPRDVADPGTDTSMCQEGYVTLTPLRSVEPAPFPREDAFAVWAPSDLKSLAGHRRRFGS